MSSFAPQELLEQAHRLSEAPDSRDSGARWEVIAALHEVPERCVFETCSSWAVAKHAFERVLAADILGQLGFRDRAFPFRSASLTILAELLCDADSVVQRSALVALSHLGSSECAAAVRRLARHESAEVRYGVVLALLADPSAESVQTMIELSRDKDDAVRDWATFGLGSQLDC